MTNRPVAAATRRREPLVRLLRKRRWSWDHGTWRKRIFDLIDCRYPWWDWGHRLMILVGQEFGGSWSEPSPPTWWYRQGPEKRMPFTGFPRHPLSTYEVIKDYDEFRRRTEGLNEDEMYEWRAMNASQDGELHLGHRYWGGPFYGLDGWDVPLLRRYLRVWHRLDWFGARSWLYKLGLHVAVNRRKPLTCQVTPPRGSGGYSHWYCGLKRRHDGPHRYGNYEWDPAKERVEYVPSDLGSRNP